MVLVPISSTHTPRDCSNRFLYSCFLAAKLAKILCLSGHVLIDFFDKLKFIAPIQKHGVSTLQCFERAYLDSLSWTPLFYTVAI